MRGSRVPMLRTAVEQDARAAIDHQLHHLVRVRVRVRTRVGVRGRGRGRGRVRGRVRARARARARVRAEGVRCAPPESAAEFSQLPSTKVSVPVTTSAYSPCCNIDSGSRGPPG